jgi:hypothetical protein
MLIGGAIDGRDFDNTIKSSWMYAEIWLTAACDQQHVAVANWPDCPVSTSMHFKLALHFI